jgi:hypothetical protein
LGHILGDFFTNSSGHPPYGRESAAPALYVCNNNTTNTLEYFEKSYFYVVKTLRTTCNASVVVVNASMKTGGKWIFLVQEPILRSGITTPAL